MVKPVYQQPIDAATYIHNQFFENILKIVHPFMPFNWKLWHDNLFVERSELDCGGTTAKVGELVEIA